MIEECKNRSDSNDWWGPLSDYLNEQGRGLFLGTRHGIYRHEIIGLFDSLIELIKVSVKVIEAESDHYHNIDIVEIGINEKVEFDNYQGTLYFREKTVGTLKYNEVTNSIQFELHEVYS